MKRLLLLLKPCSFLPALLMMCLIFRFSAQTGEESGGLSYQVSHAIVEVGNRVLDLDLREQEVEDCARRLEYPVRKLAHFSEYFLLAATVLLPFYVYGMRGVHLYLVTAVICVAFAAGDEYHQSFVEGRGPSVRDVGIDSLGALTELLFTHVCSRVYTHFHRVLPGEEPLEASTDSATSVKHP